MAIGANSRITILDKPLHGNDALLLEGQVIAINGNSASVQIEGEDVPRIFALDKLKTTEEIYGAERTSPHDNGIIDAIRRN